MHAFLKHKPVRFHTIDWCEYKLWEVHMQACDVYISFENIHTYTSIYLCVTVI